MQGEVDQILVNVTTATVGVYLIAVAFEGYFMRPVGWIRRGMLGGVGLVAMVPDTALGFHGVVAVAGAGVGLAMLGYEYIDARRARRTASSASSTGV